MRPDKPGLRPTAETHGRAYPKIPAADSKTKQQIRADQDRRFRAAVWDRDHGIDRATGIPVEHYHDNWRLRGEVHHLRSRRAAPELRVNPSNGVLLSVASHWLADGRGGRLLRLTDPATGEPATDANQPIRFTCYDRAGGVLWSRVG